MAEPVRASSGWRTVSACPGPGRRTLRWCTHSSRIALTDGARRGDTVYRAYERAAERLERGGSRIERVILDYELKRDYHRWLHERDRDRDDYDGHPDRCAKRAGVTD